MKMNELAPTLKFGDLVIVKGGTEPLRFAGYYQDTILFAKPDTHITLLEVRETLEWEKVEE